MSALSLSLPPSGVCVYGRAQSLEWLAQWSCVFLHFQRSDTPAKAAALKARGTRVWLWGGPDAFDPTHYAVSLTSIVDLAARLGCEGVLVNPEVRWPDLPAAERNRLAAHFGVMCKNASSQTRIGMVSYPVWPALNAFADACRGHVWGSPEVYNETTVDPRYYTRWEGAFGPSRVIPSIGAWEHSAARYHDRQSYDAYLAMVPRAVGAIAFTTGERPRYMWEALHDWSPSGPLVLRPVYELRALLGTWQGVILVVVAAIVLLLIGSLLLRKVSHV